MLNSIQLQKLRHALAAQPDLRSFEIWPLARATVRAVGSPDIRYAGPPGTSHMRRPARMFGEPEEPSCLVGISDAQSTTPAPTLYAVEGGTVVGNEAVIDASGGLYMPKPIDSRAAMDSVLAQNAHNRDGFLLNERDGAVEAIYVAPYLAETIGLTALFLHDLEPGNYGSFLLRQLPQMLMAQRAEASFDCYVVPARTSWLLEAMREAGMPERPVFALKEVIGRPFRRVLVWSVIYAEGCVAADTLPGLNRLSGGVQPSGRKKIYASRLLSSTYRPGYRVLVNEPQIEALAHRAGFEVIYPETLSFREQIRTFAAATHIFGPSGSGMLNAIFAAAGCKLVDMESYHVTVRQHAKAYSSTGKEYAFGFGRFCPEQEGRPKHARSWSMALDDVGAAIEWLAS